VLWRYDGKKPDTLGPNTQLFKWIPQNDLLGHPKTKAFVTHGGSNGIYEAIYHGIPMVGLPLFADQPHNIVHMMAKGAAVRLDLETMSTEDLLNALKEEMEEFVQSSGEHGIVVFSLGSMVSNMSEERANVIASALAQIPQKVLWRYDGKKPDTLGPNTRLYKWIPQNDNMEAFAQSSGEKDIVVFSLGSVVTNIKEERANMITSALAQIPHKNKWQYLPMYHGIPKVRLLMFVDQPDNIPQMKVKGAAVRLDLETMSRSDLFNELKQAINNHL
ncbi:hypothetical protein Celaphus_00017450, partial [Cervus elaphus hippelaphus]